jgi:hypothetical protein
MASLTEGEDRSRLPAQAPLSPMKSMSDLDRSSKLAAVSEPPSDIVRLAEAIEKLNKNQESLALLVKQALNLNQHHDRLEVNNRSESNDVSFEHKPFVNEESGDVATEKLGALFPTPERLAATFPVLIGGLQGGGATSHMDELRGILALHHGDSTVPRFPIDPMIVLNSPAPLQIGWGLRVLGPTAEASDQLRHQWPSPATLRDLDYSFHLPSGVRNGPPGAYFFPGMRITCSRPLVCLFYMLVTP